MAQENKQCQNCKNEFTIEPEDFEFYEKMKVPAPTWCSQCRLIRRMTYRNERTLYKRKCDAPSHSEEIISVFSPDKTDRIYCQKSWWGDGWDGIAYERDYDFSKSFFEQLRDLWKEVPDMALLNINSVNSDYCSITEGNKNCYLVIGGDFNENSLYSAFIFHCKDVVDCYWSKKCELCYELSDCLSCHNVLYSRFCEGCFDSTFLYNCKNSHHCFGCANLRNVSYQIFNKQYTKDEYEKKVKEFAVENYTNRESIKQTYENHIKRFPRKFARILNSVNCTGDNIEHAKNIQNSFDVFDGAEDSFNLWLTYSQIKDSADLDHSGRHTELSYECSTLYPAHRVLFSRFIFNGSNIEYSYNCHNSSNLFGCVGLRNKNYCILNKQYSKEDYEDLIVKIRDHMNELSYTDKGGQVYKYGEFFPIELSPFAYNETVAFEIEPMSEKEVLEKGYSWKNQEKRDYEVTLESADLPDHIKDIKDDILNEVIGCQHEGKCNEQCTEAFKIIKPELEFYKKMNLPLPRLCPNCRHYQRIKQRNPLKLWHRKCMCAGEQSNNKIYKNTVEHTHHGKDHCLNEFETSYAPDRKEIIYCEKCYQSEVV